MFFTVRAWEMINNCYFSNSAPLFYVSICFSQCAPEKWSINVLFLTVHPCFFRSVLILTPEHIPEYSVHHKYYRLFSWNNIHWSAVIQDGGEEEEPIPKNIEEGAAQNHIIIENYNCFFKLILFLNVCQIGSYCYTYFYIVHLNLEPFFYF